MRLTWADGLRRVRVRLACSACDDSLTVERLDESTKAIEQWLARHPECTTRMDVRR